MVGSATENIGNTIEQPVQQTMQQSVRSSNKLTTIRGIGPIKKRWLKVAGIHTLTDLASASAVELVTEIRALGHTIADSEVSGWIAQAQELLKKTSAISELAVSGSAVSASIERSQSTTPISDSGSTSDSTSDSISDSISNSATHPDLHEPTNTDWQSSVVFQVELQTRHQDDREQQQILVRQLETNTEFVWTEASAEPLHRMLNQVDISSLSPSAPTPKPAIAIEITQLQIRRRSHMGIPMLVNKTHCLFPSSVQAGEPIALELALNFTGLNGLNLCGSDVQQLVYRVQCHARHLPTGTVLNLGDRVVNVPVAEHSTYTALLSDVTFPQPGPYRLQILVTLQNLPATPGQFKVPLLPVL